MLFDVKSGKFGGSMIKYMMGISIYLSHDCLEHQKNDSRDGTRIQ